MAFRRGASLLREYDEGSIPELLTLGVAFIDIRVVNGPFVMGVRLYTIG